MRLQQELARAPGSYPEFITATPTTLDDLQPLFEERRAAYEAAPHIIAAGAASSADVAKMIADRFGWPL